MDIGSTLRRVAGMRLSFPGAQTPEAMALEAASDKAERSLRQTQVAFQQILRGVPEIEMGLMSSDLPYPNPDELIDAKGIEIWDEMDYKDDVVTSALTTLYLGVLSVGSKIVPGDDTPEAQRAADFQIANYEQMLGTDTQRREQIISGVGDGFSINEIVWAKPLEFGEFAHLQPFEKIVSKSNKYIEFKTEEFGKVAKDGVWQRSYTGHTTYTKAPLEKVIYYAHRPRHDNPYGSPLKRPMYPWYFFKQFTLKNWAIFIERYGLPFAEGTVPPETSDDDRSKFLDMLMNIRKRWAAVKVDGDTINFRQVDFKAADSHENAIRFCNRSMMRASQQPSLLTESEGAGSYALGKAHISTHIATLKYYGECLAEEETEQILRLSHEYNFGPHVPCPRVEPNTYETTEVETLANICVALQGMGLPFSIEALRTHFGNVAAAPIDEEDELKKATQIPSFPAQTEQDKTDIAEMAYDWARGNLRGEAPAMWTFDRRGKRPLTELESQMNFEQNDRDEDADVEATAETIGVCFEAIANDLAVEAGKEYGARL